MYKRIVLLILLIIIPFSYVYGKESKLSPEAQKILEAKGFKILGFTPQIISSRKDTLTEDQKFLKINVSFNLNKSGIKPIWMGKPQQHELSKTTTEIIMTEDFEGSFPGAKWQRSGNPTWGKTNYEKHTGSYSAWCAKDGTSGVEPGGSYPVNFESIMIYGPFDLSDVNYAELNFWHWLDTEYEKDWFFCGASTDSVSFSGIGMTGETGFWTPFWTDETLFLSNVPGLGSVCGKSKVWIAFSFVSDNHSSDDKGVYLDDVLLTKRNVQGTPIVGAIAGRLTRSGSPYIAVNNVGVAEVDSLVIEPGVEVRFDGPFEFIVQGFLSAVGTVQDSIVFTSNKTNPKAGDWRAIGLYSNGILRISYSIITYGGCSTTVFSGYGGVFCNGGNTVIRNSRVSNNITGVSCFGGQAQIENNQIVKNGMSGYLGGNAIYCSSSAPLIIKGNVIKQNIGAGIRVMESDPTIQANVIEENNFGISGEGSRPVIIDNLIQENAIHGIDLSYHGFGGDAIAVISNNRILNNNFDGIAISSGYPRCISGNVIAGNGRNGIVIGGDDFTLIVNNTIANNAEMGVLVTGQGPHSILNNIIFRNGLDGVQAQVPQYLEIMYNDFFGNSPNFTQISSDSLGILSRRNANDDSCDLYFNIMRDPSFVNPTSNNYHLQTSSPCIDAGDPHLLFVDMDGSPNDMGAFGGNGLIVRPTAYDFGRVVVNGSRTASFDMINARDTAIIINSVSLSDQSNFSLSPSTTIQIPHYEKRTLTVAFSPKSIANFSSVLTISSNNFIGANSSQIHLTGQGIKGTMINGGYVSGTWDILGSPYIIKSDIYVEKGSSLTIQPGVEVLFEDGRMQVRGRLTAVGTPNDSITFSRSHPSKSWKGIFFDSADTLSRLEYCTVEHSVDGGLRCVNGSHITIKHCKIRTNTTVSYNRDGAGIYCWKSSPKIMANAIENNTAGTNGGGIYCDESSPVIEGNLIQNNFSGSGGGMLVTSSSPHSISNNLIAGNIALDGGGVYLGSSDSPYNFSNNVVIRNKGKYSGGGISGSNSNGMVYILNNTIAYNSAKTGGGMLLKGDSFSILTSIFFSNTAGRDSQISISKNVSILYNAIQGGWQGEGNLDVEPLFVDPANGDYHLQPNSPCIDKGNPDPQYNDPEDPNNPGYALYPALGTVRNDMGAYGGPGAANWNIATAVESKPEELANLPKTFELFQNYPNPFNPTTTIKYQLPQRTEVSLKIYNLLGQLVRTLVDEKQMAGNYSVIWDGKNDKNRVVSSGLYFYTLRTKDFVQSRKMILIR